MRTFYGEWDQSADVPIVANYMVLNYGLHVFSIEIFIIRIAQSKFWLNLYLKFVRILSNLSNFTLNSKIDSPEIFYLYLKKDDGDSLNDRILFFGV